MMRMVYRPVLLLLGLLVLPILVIRAQPYDETGLGTFLTPPKDCPAPCLMGIRPGVTPFYQARRILQTHGWIEQVTETQRYRNRWAYVFWAWNGSQAYLPAGGLDNALSTDIEVAGDLSIQTRIAPIEIWWFYGPPRWIQQIAVENQRTQFLFGYPQQKLIVLVELTDCATWLDVLTAPSRLTYSRWVFNKPERFPADYLIEPDLARLRSVQLCQAAGRRS
ncbi:MAG: hypothetical protein CL610_22025 [Anaerolineaceae bacterium]|nr:hypothetical protein [Anaerolineaceae bacterium]